MAEVAPQRGHLRVSRVEVAETDGPGWAGLLTRRGHGKVRQPPSVTFRFLPRSGNALDAIGAFLHDAPGTHGDIGVLLRFQRLGAETGVFLAVGIAEEIEAANL